MLPKDHRHAFSQIELSVWLEVFGDQYPLDSMSYTTLGELDEAIASLSLAPESVLLDMGCGRGGPGKYVAESAGCALVGLDVSAEVLDYARTSPPYDPRHRFDFGSFGASRLPSDSVDGILCIDSLFFANDKQAALSDLARVARTSSRMVLTGWDYAAQPLGRPRQVEDHRPLLRRAGFRVLEYRDSPRWYPRQRDILVGLSGQLHGLAEEVEMHVDHLRRQLADLAQTVELVKRRFFCVAELR